MARLGSLRGWRAALVAGFLAFAVLIPTIDTCICIGEADQETSVSVIKDLIIAAVTKLPLPPLQSHDDADNSCIHGHCHHWAALVKLSDRVLLDVTVKKSELVAGLYNPPASVPQLRLLRPPRA